jgi:ribosomal-protein-alanine N-acetyltransferase
MIKFKTDLWRNKTQGSLNYKLLAPTFLTGRLIIQAPVLSDYEDWQAVRASNQDFLKPFEPEWPQDCLTQDFFDRRLKRQHKDREQGRGAYFFLKTKETSKIIGGLNLNNIHMGAACHASLGYWLDKNQQGRGYMREAIQKITEYSFDTLGLKRLNAACLPDNDRSIKMLLKLGFEEEGYAKKYLQINGHWQDHRLFGLCNQS